MRFPDLLHEVKALEDRLEGLIFEMGQLRRQLEKTQTELIRAFPDAQLWFSRAEGEVSRETCG